MFFKKILNKGKKILNEGKDTLVQVVGARISKKYLKTLGKMTKLRLDSENREISLTLELQGEPIPIELKIQYEILNPTQIEIKHVHSSRDWIATLVNEVIPSERKRINVPSIVATALSKLIH